jgi:hypothetical protein
VPEAKIELTDKENEVIRRYAEIHGKALDQAINEAVAESLANRIKRTGHAPAKVYGAPKR